MTFHSCRRLFLSCSTRHDRLRSLATVNLALLLSNAALLVPLPQKAYQQLPSSPALPLLAMAVLALATPA